MKVAKLTGLSLVIFIMICGGCGQQTDNSAAREWAFETEKVWVINQVGEDPLLRPAEPRVADDGTLYFHDFDRHMSYIIDNDNQF